MGRNIADNYGGIIISEILLFFRMFILHLQMTLNITFSEWVNLLSIYRVQNKFSRLDISDSYVGIFLYSCYLNSWLMILNFYPTFNVRWYLWKYDIYIQWVYKEDILVNIAYNYVSISVYFRKLWFKESQLSYSQHEILGNLYEFMINVSKKSSISSLKRIFPANMLEYLFVSVWSVISVCYGFIADIPYALSLK